MPNFLAAGKRGLDDSEKRAAPRPFLGKRNGEIDEDKRGMRPFLGKRSMDDEEKRGLRPFLGEIAYFQTLQVVFVSIYLNNL